MPLPVPLREKGLGGTTTSEMHYTTLPSVHLWPLLGRKRHLLPGIEQRPADVLLPNFSGGKHCLIDICVVSSLQSQLVNRAAKEAGYALQHRYGQKWDKYGPACQAEGYVFKPLPIEVL